MNLTKSVHVGGITRKKEIMLTVVRTSRAHIIRELNNWLFDYQYAHDMPISKLVQLPPLDDFNHSLEDNDYWYIDLNDFHIWIKTEYIDY